jgi:hypothetical protein
VSGVKEPSLHVNRVPVLIWVATSAVMDASRTGAGPISRWKNSGVSTKAWISAVACHKEFGEGEEAEGKVEELGAE